MGPAPLPPAFPVSPAAAAAFMIYHGRGDGRSPGGDPGALRPPEAGGQGGPGRALLPPPRPPRPGDPLPARPPAPAAAGRRGHPPGGVPQLRPADPELPGRYRGLLLHLAPAGGRPDP